MKNSIIRPPIICKPQTDNNKKINNLMINKIFTKIEKNDRNERNNSRPKGPITIILKKEEDNSIPYKHINNEIKSRNNTNTNKENNLANNKINIISSYNNNDITNKYSKTNKDINTNKINFLMKQNNNMTGKNGIMKIFGLKNKKKLFTKLKLKNHKFIRYDIKNIINTEGKPNKINLKYNINFDSIKNAKNSLDKPNNIIKSELTSFKKNGLNDANIDTLKLINNKSNSKNKRNEVSLKKKLMKYNIMGLKHYNNMVNNINININNNNGIHAKYTKDQYLQYLNDSFLYKNCYMKVIDIVRERLCLKMTKPLEVKIDIDENGDIAYDPTKNTIYQTIHENMRETLIYLTYIDPYKTQNLLHAKINEQYDIARQQNKINPSLLNSISWSAGCISGAMNDTIEMQFLIVFIKVLLNLCEIIRGKGNKAICASNIMYVVGQYPKFLNNHWKFLKTVVKKLFEFMHESFEGVQDFACETFLKISIKCARNFTILQQNESEEYIKDLVRNVSETTKDLKPHQQLMFYEAIGNMINSENNISKKTFYIKQLMNEKDMQWNQIFDEAKRNINILNNNNVVKGLSLIILLNERVSFSTKTPYWSYGLNIFENLIKSFIFYSQCINQHFENNKAIDMNIRSYMIYNRTLIKFLTSLVKNTDDVQLIQNDMLPSFGKLIETYNNNHVNNKDPNMLLLFSAILEKIQNKNPEVVATIWKLLSSSTIQLIKNDYESYPEHRMNFFILLKSLISNSFESLFRAQNLSFNKDVIDTITFAINHNTPSMSETGLETLLILLQKVISVKNIDLQNIVDPFFSNYFFILFNDVFNTMTDGFHQSGFKLQVKVIQILIRVIDNKVISENLFDKNEINRNFFLKKLLMDILNSFKNIQQTQGEALCLAMMNNCTDDHKFKSVMRDFLVSLKSFLGNNDILWEEEKKKELEMAQRIEEQKKSFLPGPQYDTQINANNYQDNNMNI